MEKWAKDNGRDLPSGIDISKDSDIQDIVATEIKNNMADFQPKYMRVKAFVIVPGELTLDAGELTPTMKVIRHNVLEKYNEWCDALYRSTKYPDKLNCIVPLK